MLLQWLFFIPLLTDVAFSIAGHENGRNKARVVSAPRAKRQIISGPNGYQFNVLHHLSGIAPYFDSPGVQLNPAPPQGCEVAKATYLIRHSNIFANSFDYASLIEPFTAKLGNFTERQSFSNASGLAFLANWTSPITDAAKQVSQLTPSGAQSATAFGSMIPALYPGLAPFNATGGSFKVWSATAQRALDSARAFMRGAFPQNGSQLVEVPESEDAGANTLAPHESCPNFDAASGTTQSEQFLQTYAGPIVHRFNTAVPGFNFTAHDVVAMQQLCGYETVITNSSSFCTAFSELEWLGFEYTNDIKYSYEIGYGNPTSSHVGMPWLNASVTLLASPNTSQNLYFSFTHREEPAFVATALGIFNNSDYTGPMSSDINSTMLTSEINFNREWRTSFILPFLGHVALERLECPSFYYNATTSGNSTTKPVNSTLGEIVRGDDTTFVRALVNGAPIPIRGCQDGPGASCGLDDFVSYIQGRAQTYGDFDGACGVHSTNAANSLMIYS